MNNSSLDTKCLGKVSGLSRSATLARLRRLVKRGFVVQSAKVGTEHWITPHYEFAIALSPDQQLELAEFLGLKIPPKVAVPEQRSFEEQLAEVLFATAKAIGELKCQVTVLEQRIL